MKLNKIILPLALALIATLSTTGCRHGLNGKTTDLKGPRHIGGDNTLNGPAPFTPTPIPNEPVNATPAPYTSGPIETSTNWDPYTMNQDVEKLKAYTVHFKFDSSVVQDNEQAHVAAVVQALGSDLNAKLVIQGHCDERGTEEYNRSLGERRALALRESLAKAGLDPMRIRTISFGKDQPEDPAHNEGAWSKNRRGVFIYCTPKAPIQ